MKKIAILLILLLAIFACDDAKQMFTPLIPAGTSPPTGMVLIPAGEVTIGLSQAQLERHTEQYPQLPTTLEAYTTAPQKAHLPAIALPEQTVHVDAFYVDIYEVTWEKYLTFVEASGYESENVVNALRIFPDLIDRSGYFGNEPITQLTVAEMKAYAEFYGKQIPTEIEWEKAARGGLADMNYPWGNTITPENCNYNHTGSSNAFSSDGKTQYLFAEPVGQYEPNAYGLHDMAGNVSEYVTTQWDTTPSGGDVSSVVTRGGNYRRPGYEHQNWYRKYHTTGLFRGTVGFRCIKRINGSAP